MKIGVKVSGENLGTSISQKLLLAPFLLTLDLRMFTTSSAAAGRRAFDSVGERDKFVASYKTAEACDDPLPVLATRWEDADETLSVGTARRILVPGKQRGGR